MLTLLVLWLLFCLVSYSYFESLFLDLGLKWSAGNKTACALLAITGPAAMVLALCVDATRPLHAIV